jgi:hypothetical protein
LWNKKNGKGKEKKKKKRKIFRLRNEIRQLVVFKNKENVNNCLTISDESAKDE